MDPNAFRLKLPVN